MTALDALHRCYDAWRETQPQLFWTDENLYGLGNAATSARGVPEPAGFTSGAEPRVATPEVLTAPSHAPCATPNAQGSAPTPHEGSAATPIPESAADPRRSF